MKHEDTRLETMSTKNMKYGQRWNFWNDGVRSSANPLPRKTIEPVKIIKQKNILKSLENLLNHIAQKKHLLQKIY